MHRIYKQNANTETRTYKVNAHHLNISFFHCLVLWFGARSSLSMTHAGTIAASVVVVKTEFFAIYLTPRKLLYP